MAENTPPPTSIREKVVAAFATRLSAARAEQLDSEQDLPARVIWDPAETAERNQYGKYEITLSVNVAEMAERNFEVNSSVQGNAMLANLLNAALGNDPTLGGLCKQINYTDSQLDSPDSGQTTMIVLATFDIVYRINNTNPFQQ